MGPAIAFRPPEPTSGNSVEMAYGYQIKAGLTGGNSVNPVLFFDKFSGFLGSKKSPTTPVS